MLSWFKRKHKKEEIASEPLPVEETGLEELEATQENLEEELAEDLFFEVPATDTQEPQIEIEIEPDSSKDDQSLSEISPLELETGEQQATQQQNISIPDSVEDTEPPLRSEELPVEVEEGSETEIGEPKTHDIDDATVPEEIVIEEEEDTDTLPPSESLDNEAGTISEHDEPLDEPVLVDDPVGEIDDKNENDIEPVKPVTAEEAVSVAASKGPQDKPQEKRKSFFSRLADRLSRTRESFTYQLDTLFLGKKEIDAELLDDLEELLITADLGVSTTQEILDHARKKVKRNDLSDPQSLKTAIQEKIKSFISDYQEDAALVMPDEGPFVIMVVGVNGVGKTTTIGKVAHKFIRSGQSVLLVAADTFRAAAISQLKIWGERNNIPVATQEEGTDPSSVVFDALAHAKSKKYDVVLVDTAGRLHTQANLMEELKKIKRVMAKQLEGAPHEVMLIVDATTGQNGISQAKLFNEAVDITGITLTKLDGTAKGGIVANICRELKTPIRFIGIGETIDDLRDFDTDEFIEALFQDRNSGVEE